MIFVLLAAAAIATTAGVVLWRLVAAREQERLNPLPPPLFHFLVTAPTEQPQPAIDIPRPAAPRAAPPPAREIPPAAPRAPLRAVKSHDFDDDNAETVRFVRPSDASVQLLPGRLEVLDGATPHREIRFVRVPGEPVHVVLGREVGVSPHYVGLESPTVSRRHARFDYAGNRWIVKNLSKTNPLVVNDDVLYDADIARPLLDGDRLEIGEIVLRFHAQ